MKKASTKGWRLAFVSSSWFRISIGMLVALFLIFYVVDVQAQEAQLKHRYTFEDGTAKDVVGDADGTMKGGEVLNGEYVAFEPGQFIQLPADKIQVNTYEALTLEAYVVAGHLNAYYTMLSYFGNKNGKIGTDYLFQSLSNAGFSNTAISCNEPNVPWEVATNVFSPMLRDLKYHHVVSTFDNTTIKFYVDGVLVNENSIAEFPNNTIQNLSNEYAYLCKSGYKSDPTWFGAIDAFNIYEGVLDATSIAERAGAYLNDERQLSVEVKKMLTNVLGNPGFRPKTKKSKTFLNTYNQSAIVVYPTVIRTIDSTAWSSESGRALAAYLNQNLSSNTRFEETILNPGELEGKSQFQFFNNDMDALSAAAIELWKEADYHIILEILFAPQRSEAVEVFGVHLLILDSAGENAFSFLLNSHHDYFTYNNLIAENSNEENIEELQEKCTRVIAEALMKQLEYEQKE